MKETELLFDLLKKGVSPVQAVRACKERLESAGFLELPYDEPWKLQKNGRYYVNHHDTTLFAFTVGEGWQETKTPQIRMAAAHTDFPCLRIKPSADVTACGYAQVNVEVYGGAILNTWLDRPLGIAGRVAVRTQDAFAPKIVEFVSEKNLLTIPNLAIHMNREVNKGVELNRQTDMLPVFALLPEEEKKADYFLTFLADELSVEKTDILDFELTVYCKENPEFIGLNDDFISSPRLDNLTSCAALISGLIDARRMEGINLIALFDHEEIGSHTKQGAGSILLHDMLRRILKELGREQTAEIEKTDGEILFNGEDISKYDKKQLRDLRTKMQIIFQDPYSSLSPRLPIGEIIGEAVREHGLVPKEQFDDYITKVMKDCGLQEYHKDRYPHEFSGGQRQRICIARALALNPEFIVCDEPVSALDVSIQAQIINLLRDLQKERGLTYLFISHDLSVVEHISDTVGVMYLGGMVESGETADIFGNPLHPYTKALFSAIPMPAPQPMMRRVLLKGDIPSPANPPAGCKFHTRCSECMEICKHEEPQVKDVGNGHKVKCHLYDEK